MKWRFGGVLLVVLLAVMASTVVMAQGSSGTISGRVIDTNGQPIPGADVVVTSKYLQGPRGTATNLDGEYLIPYLPPGNDYKISVEAVGYNKVIQSNVTVSLGTATTLQVTLTSGGTEVEVTSRPPVITLKDTKVATTLTQQEMEMLPLQRGYQQTLYLAPNVVSSGMGGNPGVAGSTGSENIFMINGLNTTDPVTGTFGTNLNFNFIREMEVNTGGLDAEYGASTGGLFNVLTKSGTNELHGEVFAYYTDQSFNANAHSTDMSVNKPQPFHNYDYGFDVGGPIIKDRLWYFVGYNPTLYTTHYEGTSSVTNIFTGAQVEVPYKYDNLSRNWFSSAKFNYRVNDKHNLELAVFTDPSHMWYNEGPFPTIDARALHTRRYQGGYNVVLKWYATWSSKIFMETGVGKTHSILQILPWDNAGFGQPEILSYNFSPSLSLGPGTGTIDYDNRDSFQAETKVTWLLGRNEIKFGANYEDLKWDNFQGYTGGIQYAPYINLPGTNQLSPRLRDYKYVYEYTLQNPAKKEYGKYIAAFVQDKWSITDYQTLSAGVRFERNEVLPGNGGATLGLNSYSPRIGYTWDFARNGKSKFYMNYGLYYERTPIAMAAGMDPGHASYTDITKYGAPFLHYAYSTVATTVAGGTENQYNTEFLIGAEYEVKPNLTLGLSALYRTLGRVLEDVGYVDSKGNIDYIIMNPGTGQWPAIMSNWSKVLPDYERFPHPIRNYSAYTLTANKRFSNHWFMNASYTYSTLVGNYEGGSGGLSLAGLNPNASSAYDIPEHILNVNTYGYLPQDIRHSVKVQGSYKFDFGLVLGINLTARSGIPLDKLYGYPRNDAGYGTLFASPRGSDRMPGIWQLDLHAEYDMKLWKTDMAFFVDVFNVTNNQQATFKYDTYYYTPNTLGDVLKGNLTRDPNWGKTTARQAPRQARVGVRWSF